MPDWCSTDGKDVLIRVKAVPGASRDQIAGLLGDRLKIRIAAPPEDGKANAAICGVLARALDVGVRNIVIEHGSSGPEKLVRAKGVARVLAETLVQSPSQP